MPPSANSAAPVRSATAPVKAPRDVAEQFAFGELAGNGAAIDGDEGLLGATGGMDRLGAQFLAGAAFAGDEHGGAGWSDAFDLIIDGAHRRRPADKACEVGLRWRRCDGRLNRRHRRRRAPVGEGCFKAFDQPPLADRLGDEIGCAGAHGGNGGRDRTALAQRDDAAATLGEARHFAWTAYRIDVSDDDAGTGDGARLISRNAGASAET